jgi:hypothetical protein
MNRKHICSLALPAMLAIAQATCAHSLRSLINHSYLSQRLKTNILVLTMIQLCAYFKKSINKIGNNIMKMIPLTRQNMTSSVCILLLSKQFGWMFKPRLTASERVTAYSQLKDRKRTAQKQDLQTKKEVKTNNEKLQENAFQDGFNRGTVSF